MAEVVDEMPQMVTGDSGGKYPWEQWLDGRVWKLTQSVTLEPVLDDATGVVLVGEQEVEGDFSVGLEKMRTYARNACNRRQPKLKLKSRTETEVIEVVRVPGEAPVKVGRKVMYLQSFEAGPKLGEGAVTTTEAPKDEQLALDLADVNAPAVDEASVAAVQADLDGAVAAAGDAVRQSDIEQPEGEPEWAEIAPSEDPDDPYAPAVTEPWPATDPADEVVENPGTSFVPGAAPAGLVDDRPVAADGMSA